MPESVALLEQSYCVFLAVGGDEGEEVGGLGAGGEVEGVAARGGGGQLNLLGAAHDVGEVGGGDGLLAGVFDVHALAEGVLVVHKGIAVDRGADGDLLFRAVHHIAEAHVNIILRANKYQLFFVELLHFKVTGSICKRFLHL